MAKIKAVIKIPSFWLGIFILTSFIVGLSIFQDFGISFDEPGIYRFTPVALQMYSTAFNPPSPPVFQREAFLYQKRIDPILFNYGPFYFMLVDLFTHGLQASGLDLPSWDLWHLAYFLTFEACIMTFYLLCRRWLNGWASLVATLLFATQPLIVGHAFMNPKDPPFMFFFMASIHTGLLMADKIVPVLSKNQLTTKEFPIVFQTEWRALQPETIKSMRRHFLVLGSMMLFIILTNPLWHNILQKVISSAYNASLGSLVGNILRIFSSHPEKIPLENFLTKGQIWLTRFEWLVVLLIIGRAIWVLRSTLPKSGRAAAQILFEPFRQFIESIINPFIILSGVLFGLTTSIRLFAPLAGGIVVVYLLSKARWRGIIPALAYGCVASITTYITWPYLWGAPIRRIIKSWQVMREFSNSGAFLTLPNLLRFQYTEPAVLLALIGIVITIVLLIRKNSGDFSFLFLIWTAIPLGIMLWQHTNLYDNFRQALFLMPPFFIMAGLAIEKIIKLIRQPILIAVFILLTLFPGIYSIVRLHPYEYIYYNQFVGGLQGAFRNFNTDYWGISFKEIAEYLNRTAPLNSRMIVYGPDESLTPYLRPDLKVISSSDEAAVVNQGNVYLVTYSQSNNDLLLYPQAAVVYAVARDQAIFSVVKLLSTAPK